MRRSTSEILLEIMTNCQQPMLFSYVMDYTHMSYTQAKDYMTRLVGAGYLEIVEEGRRKLYHTTEKGMKLLRKGQEILAARKELEAIK